MTESVIELWRFPVKSMQGQRLQKATITELGLLCDRAYGLVDTQTGQVASAKSVKLFPDLMACRATFVAPPQAGRAAPPVRIELPNDKSVRSDSDDIDRVLSAYFRRDVRLVRAAPGILTADQYRPVFADAVAENDANAAVAADPATPCPAAAGAFRDAYPVSVLTTSTLARLNALRPDSRFDSRRFRMNIIVKTEQPGFIENDWLDHELALGGGTRLSVAARDPRCVMTTRAQDDLPRDPDILRTIARYNRIPVGDAGERPCAGVYAAVAAPGTVRTHDPVSLA